MKVAVLIPTRDRPSEFLQAVKSVRVTSNAHVLAYVDEDQADLYPVNGEVEGATIHVGPRIGPVASANFLVRENPGYGAYGLITDDSRIVTHGWDQYVMGCFNDLHRLAVVSPHHNHGNHVDMPFVSREWIDAVGWYACPDFFHYCWPIVTGLVGEMTAIVHCAKTDFSIDHDYDENANMSKREADNARFFDYVTLKMMGVVWPLREMMS